ncbi:tetratricopeptide repeat protein [Thalassobaculum sp.]
MTIRLLNALPIAITLALAVQPSGGLAQSAGTTSSSRPDQSETQAAEMTRQAIQLLATKSSQAERRRAVQMLGAAAELRQPDALFALGALHAQGKIVKHDAKRATALYREAARQGHLKAMNALALHMIRGDGTAQDFKGAIALLQRASDAGLTAATTNLGQLYLAGVGHAKDPVTGLRLLEKAAATEDPAGVHELAVALAEGVHTRKDVERAAALFQKAADAGYSRSQYSLGILKVRGEGVPQDPVDGLKWMMIAASTANGEAKVAIQKVLNELAQKLGGDAVGTAGEAAQIWMVRRGMRTPAFRQ